MLIRGGGKKEGGEDVFLSTFNLRLLTYRCLVVDALIDSMFSLHQFVLVRQRCCRLVTVLLSY